MRTSRGYGDGIVYRLGLDGRITALGDAWAESALAHQAPELATGERLPLWDAISDPTSRLLWQSIVARVREESVTLEVPYRCDAPDVRRWFVMRVTPEGRGGGGVVFESFLVRDEPRLPVRLLDPSGPRAAAEPVVLCGWCARAVVGADWVEIETAVSRLGLLAGEHPPPLSHGICPDCAERVEAIGGRTPVPAG